MKFLDNAKRTWSIALDGPTIRRIRQETKTQLGQEIDLADESGKAYETLVKDPCALVSVLYLLLEDQIAEATIDEKSFAKALTGDALDRATQALLEAMIDFFPRRSREVLRAVAAKQDKLLDVGHTKAMARLNDPQVEAQLVASIEAGVDRELEALLTRLNSATASPGSSASAPAD